MVSRRNFFKTFGIVTTATVFNPMQLTRLHASSNPTSYTSFFSKKQRLVLIGTSHQSSLLIDYIREHSSQFELVHPMGGAQEILHFTSFEQFKQSGLTADLIFISGTRNSVGIITEALEHGCNVWVDRLPAFERSICSKINNIASGNFCKVNIMYVINKQLCLMPNKIIETSC